jgi:8-hydroxy-5-deazaflavin:NADPH oxidoreductase
MKIGIIGAGNIGGNLAQLLVQRGHEVTIANSRGPGTLDEVAQRTGATPAEAAEAPRGAEVVILAVPLKAVAGLPAGLLDDVAPGAVVIDTNNYYPQRDGQIRAIDEGMTSSRWVSEQIGHPVIKVFNNIVAAQLLSRSTPPATEGRRALPVAGDDTAAKTVVLNLVDELGFDAVDIGGLDESWRYQPGTPAYGPDVDAAKLVELLRSA